MWRLFEPNVRGAVYIFYVILLGKMPGDGGGFCITNRPTNGRELVNELSHATKRDRGTGSLCCIELSEEKTLAINKWNNCVFFHCDPHNFSEHRQHTHTRISYSYICIHAFERLSRRSRIDRKTNEQKVEGKISSDILFVNLDKIVWDIRAHSKGCRKECSRFWLASVGRWWFLTWTCLKIAAAM